MSPDSCRSDWRIATIWTPFQPTVNNAFYCSDRASLRQTFLLLTSFRSDTFCPTPPQESASSLHCHLYKIGFCRQNHLTYGFQIPAHKPFTISINDELWCRTYVASLFQHGVLCTPVSSCSTFSHEPSFLHSSSSVSPFLRHTMYQFNIPTARSRFISSDAFFSFCILVACITDFHIFQNASRILCSQALCKRLKWIELLVLDDIFLRSTSGQQH